MQRIILVVFSLTAATLAAIAAATEIPQDVLAGIKARADVLHRDDRASRRSYIKEQTSAYRSVQDYSNSEVPVEVVKRIRIDVSASHPHDFTKQLFYLHQQVNLFMKYGLVTSHVLPPRVVECEDLDWRLAVRGKPATYRGTIKPGSADIIYIEVRRGHRLVGQNFGFPNPNGAWEVMVWGDHFIKRSHREEFTCEKY